MKKRLFRAIIILFASVTVFFAACSPAPENGGGTVKDSGTEADVSQKEPGTEPETAAEIMPDLPETDMQGKTFTFLTCDWYSEAIWHVTDIYVDELTGDPFNDAKYNRNLAVEMQYNCKIAEINVDNVDTAISLLKKSVNAQDNAYDIFLSRMQKYQTLGADGYITDLNNLGYVDFEKPWWDRNSVRSLSIMNKLFAVCGDITTMDKEATSAIVFNKQLLADYALDDPYKLVREYNWTVDKFIEMSKAISDDLNGDGIMDKEDRFGLLYQRDTVLSFFSGSGEMIGRKDENDVPYITLTQESALTKMIYILESLYNKDSCFNVMFLDGDFNIGMDAMFQNDRGLFMWIRMINIVPLRAMNTDFGILPIPKIDKAQNYYSSDVNSWTGVCLTVPSTNTDYENTGIFFEAYAAQSHKTVQPVYYDTLLNGKIARDDESLEMLGLIFGNRTYDIGAIGTYGGLNEILYLPMDYDLNVVSYVEKRMTKAENEIAKLVDKISNLE